MCLRKRARTADRLGSPGTLTRMCRRLRFGPVRAGLVAPFGVNGEIIFFVTAAAKLSTGLLGNSVAISPGSPDSQRILGVHGGCLWELPLRRGYGQILPSFRRPFS